MGGGESHVFIEVKAIDAIPRDARLLNQGAEDFKLARTRGHDDSGKSSFLNCGPKRLARQMCCVGSHLISVRFHHNIDDFCLQK